MAVYDGVPSIRLEGDEKRALALIPEAKALLHTVQAVRKQSGANTFSMSQRIDDDSAIYVLSAMEQNIIHITVAPEVPERINEDIELPQSSAFPEFYSGLVYTGKLETRTRQDENGVARRYKVCATFSPTPNCKATHAELGSGRQVVTRLAVSPWVAFDELNEAGRANSQYTRLRSSMYSGKMKQVVQVVMGLGRINKNKLRDPTKTQPDRRYIEDVETNGVQVRFDWRFIRTHGITVAADGRLWLVEISSMRGVLAMPLPIFPQSDTAAFLARAETRGDTAMKFALEELGCLPTGEAFPSTAERVDRLVESGDILRLLAPQELRAFYECSAYSSAMGWAFNGRGSEAHNTAYYYGDDGIQRSVWYQINISIGVTVAERDIGQPIATGTASFTRNAEGRIYCPPAPVRSRFVPFKAHEPLLPGLLSHDGAPSLPIADELIPHVDTVMFVSFIDDELHVARFYRSNETIPTSVIDTVPENGCMYEGEWESTIRTGPQGIPPMMYTNIRDSREVIPASVRSTKWSSTGRGWTDYTAVSVDRIRSAFYRFRRFDNRVTSEASSNYRLATAVAVPAYSREAYYVATAKRRSMDLFSDTVSEQLLRDANFYTGNHLGIDENKDGALGLIAHAEVPGAPVSNPIVDYDWITGHYLAVTDECAVENANSGGWLPLLSFLHVITRKFPVRAAVTTTTEGAVEESAALELFTPGYGGALTLFVTADQVFDYWMSPSPNPESAVPQFIYAEHSGIGDDAVIYATGLSTYATEVRWHGYTPDVVTEEYPAFIGVNRP